MAVSASHGELQHLQLVGDQPVYDFFAERSAMRDTDKEGAIWERTYSYGLKLDGKVVAEASHIEYLMKD